MKEAFDNAVTLSKNLLGHKKYGRLIKFCITGGINTLVDWCVFFAMLYIGVNKGVCQGLGYSAGTINSYFFNKFWTFNDCKNNKKTINEIIKFLTINAITLTITIFALNYFRENLGISIGIAKVLVTVVGQIVNFLGYKLWVFKPSQ